jgi:hypothetical protein
VLGLVLLAATAAHAEERKCNTGRECSTKNYVTNPNEYGWGATADRDCTPRRVKGFGWKQKKDVLCECLPDCRAEGE